MTTATRTEAGVSLDTLPTREGWGGWDFVGDYEGTVQAYRERGDYGVTGNPNSGFFAAFAYDGVAVSDRSYADAEDAMDAADREADANPIPAEKCVR